jgi:hypothetical protein
MTASANTDDMRFIRENLTAYIDLHLDKHSNVVKGVNCGRRTIRLVAKFVYSRKYHIEMKRVKTSSEMTDCNQSSSSNLSVIVFKCDYSNVFRPLPI